MDRSLVLCNTKRCEKEGMIYVVNKVGGISETHVCLCVEHFNDKANAFIKEGYNIVQLKQSTE